MDGFTYHDIFQTKGIEYLVIIAFLLMLIPFWALINKKGMILRKIQNSLGILTTKILKIPKGVMYSNNHTWAFLEKSGIAEVGLDDWLLHLTGEVEFEMIKKSSEQIEKGELLVKIGRNEKVLNVFSPISGKIVNTNSRLQYDSSALTKDPYTKGWMYKVEPTNWKEDSASFYWGTEAEQWLKSELERFKDFVSISIGRRNPEASMIILQEGGELRDHPLNELTMDVWQDFQKIFLNV